MLITKWILVDRELTMLWEVAFLRFKIDEKINFAEWQFAMLETMFVDHNLWKPLKKPYSIATTNEELQSKWTIWCIVKKVSDWFMSDYLVKKIQIGDDIKITFPLWHYIDKNVNSNYLLISTWSGLSPNVWIFTKLIKDWTYEKIATLYWERFDNQILQSTKELFKTNNDKIYTQFFLSKEIPDLDGRSKWYIQDWLEKALQFLNTKSITVFICWIPAMVDDVRQKLMDMWIEKTNIIFEKY